MSTSYTLQYRQKGAPGWQNSAAAVTKVDGVLSGTVTGLTNGVTYEFRFERLVGGSSSKFSNAVEATPSLPAAVVNGEISGSGVFTTTLAGSNNVNINRTDNGLTMSNFPANWDWARVEVLNADDTVVAGQDFFTTRQSTAAGPAGSVRNELIIKKLSNTSIAIYLDRSVRYRITLQRTGNNSGSLLVLAF